MHVKLNLKVLKQMDDDMLRLVLWVERGIKDDGQRAKLMEEIQQKRECIKVLWDHYQKVLSRGEGKKITGS